VYWAGGNLPTTPEHPALAGATASDTIVVHDPYWTAMAKPRYRRTVTTAFERDDYSGSRNDPLLMAMPALAEPYAESRDDYSTFAALADRLGFGDQFTEGRTAMEWLVHMYEKWSAELDFDVPSFEEFWRAGRLRCRPRPG
jgi:biotin/methionine sulfoxide reductase